MTKEEHQHVVQDGTGKTIKVRSNLEIKLATILTNLNVPWTYETKIISYTIPESVHTYTVDFSINIKDIHIEGKGYLSDHTERNKYILIKQQYPDIDLRFVFENVNKLCGGTKQTHGAWATKNGFKFCDIRDKEQIAAWVREQNEK